MGYLIRIEAAGSGGQLAVSFAACGIAKPFESHT